MTDRDERPCLIGLTGNIATGKSAVGAMLTELGAQVIDADQVAHQVMKRGSPVFDEIVALFGETILERDGQIDRGALGAIVFAEPWALSQLEAIVHPAVTLEVARRVAEARAQVVVVEAIKLIEAGIAETCDALWVTWCRPKQQVQRLMSARRLSQAEAQLRIEAQPPQQDKIALADVVIDTSGTIVQTRQQVEAAWGAVTAQFHE